MQTGVKTHRDARLLRQRNLIVGRQMGFLVKIDENLISQLRESDASEKCRRRQGRRSRDQEAGKDCFFSLFSTNLYFFSFALPHCHLRSMTSAAAAVVLKNGNQPAVFIFPLSAVNVSDCVINFSDDSTGKGCGGKKKKDDIASAF